MKGLIPRMKGLIFKMKASISWMSGSILADGRIILRTKGLILNGMKPLIGEAAPVSRKDACFSKEGSDRSTAARLTK